MVLKPVQDIPTVLGVAVDLLTVSGSIIIDVIDAQKLQGSDPATLTDRASVSGEHLIFDVSVVLLTVLPTIGKSNSLIRPTNFAFLGETVTVGAVPMVAEGEVAIHTQ